MQGKPFIHRVKYSRSSQTERKQALRHLSMNDIFVLLLVKAVASATSYSAENWSTANFHQNKPSRRSLIKTMPQTGTAMLMAMKRSLTTVFVVMLFCAVSFGQIITPCPKECVCEEQYFSESQGVGAKVNCSGKKLKRFPWPLPQVTTTL